MQIVDRLLETPCYIMDFLPQQVPKDCGGQYFKKGADPCIYEQRKSEDFNGKGTDLFLEQVKTRTVAEG